MRSGFTLIELIIALTVTSLVVLTINFSMQISHQFHSNRVADQLAWHYYLSEIRAPKYDFRVKARSTKSLVLRSVAQNKTFILKYRQGELVLTTPNGGYLPLLRGLTTARFEADTRGVRSFVETKNGQKFDGNLMLEAVVDE